MVNYDHSTGRDVGGNRGEHIKEIGALSIREQVAEVMRINQNAKQAAQEGQFQKVKFPGSSWRRMRETQLSFHLVNKLTFLFKNYVASVMQECNPAW